MIQQVLLSRIVVAMAKENGQGIIVIRCCVKYITDTALPR